MTLSRARRKLQAPSAAPDARSGAARSFKAWVLPTFLSGQRSRLGVPVAPNLPDAAAASPRGRSIPLASIAHAEKRRHGGLRAVVRGALLPLSVAGLLFAFTSEALASTESPPQPQPYWRITNETIPTDVAPGGTGMFLLHVENVGDGPSVAGLPVTVVDHLPAGTVATSAAALAVNSLQFEPAGGSLALWGSPQGGSECAITEDGQPASQGRTVTCTYQPGVTVGPASALPITSYTQGAGQGKRTPPIGIAFNVEPPTSGALENSVAVSGGGAPNVASAQARFAASSTSASFGFSSFHQWSTVVDGSPATQAGSHPYELTTSFLLNNEFVTGEDPTGVLRDLQVELPPGFVGNPDAAAKCPRPDFDRHLTEELLAVCPPDSQVGTAIVGLDINTLVQLPIYNLAPPEGVPVQFGIAFERYVALLDATVKPGPDGEYRVAVDSSDVQSNGVLGATAVFWGEPAAASHTPLRYREGQLVSGLGAPSNAPLKPFLRLPTSCGVPQALAVGASSWEGALAPPLSGVESTDEQNQPVAMEGCSKLDFDPSLELSPESSATDSPTGIEANLRLPQSEDPNGLGEADLRDGTVTLPPGWTLSPAAANGLEACSPSEIGVGNEQQPACPAASKIGDLEVTTPLLEHPLVGEIYVAQQGTVDGSLLGGYLVVDDPRTGVLIKLPGRFEVGGQEGVKGLQPGQIRAIFENSPQFPFSDLKLSFFGGAHAALMTPQTCGSSSASTQFTGWNGAVVEPFSNAITTSSGCSPANTPAFTAGTASDQAGAYTPFSLTLKREDGTQRFGAVSLTLPPGLLGKLAGVSRCPNADIEAAERLNKPGDGALEQATPSCPASSELGTVTATAGPGPEPVSVTGREYLAGPYEGAPLSLDAITPAMAGPFDLGVVVVRQGLYIDKATGQPTVKSDPLPTIVQGVPLDLRSITVSVSRNGFIFNPTSCGALAVTGTVTSTEGSPVAVSSDFKAAGCSKLPFRPALSIGTGPRATKAYGASLTVKLTQKPGEANIHRLDLEIPVPLPARLTTLQKACTEAQFNANPAGCPKGAVIGAASAVTPALAQPLRGPVILVSHGNAAFPDVEMVLQSEGITIIIDGKTDIKKGVTYSRFDTAPDAPVTSFEATLPTGPNSIFSAYLHGSVAPSLCGSALKVPTELEGYNGAVIKETSKIGVTGCPRAKAAKAAGRDGRGHRGRTANIRRRVGR
jgi:hypothetical protein